MYLAFKWGSKLHGVHRADRTADLCSRSAAGVSSRSVDIAAVCWESKFIKKYVTVGRGV